MNSDFEHGGFEGRLAFVTGGASAFWLYPPAAAYVNGAVLTVDGGYLPA